jgi:branched-chain amino acid aminotransferase
MWKNKLVLINSELTTQINVLDRGLLFGDSVYEVTKGKPYHFLFLADHLARLEKSAKRLYFPNNIKNRVLSDLERLNQLLNPDQEYYLRIIVTRGVDDEIGLMPKDSTPQVILIAQEFYGYPQSWYSSGLNFMVSSIKRNSKDALDPNIKSGNYLNNMLALREAKSLGYDDAIMLNHQGHIAEATTSNIWWIKDQIIYTPALNCGLLAGITRQHLLICLKQNNYTIRQGSFKIDDILNADEAFISSSTKDLVRVCKINTKKFLPDKEAYPKILSQYRNYIKR